MTQTGQDNCRSIIAIKYFKKASELGNCDATFNLGMMYYYGTGVRQDYTIAMKYYRKAAKQGNKIAMFHIASVWIKTLIFQQIFKFVTKFKLKFINKIII